MRSVAEAPTTTAMESPSAPSELPFALVVTAVWLVTVAWLVSHHEMWRDEIQAWLLARDAESFSALLPNLSYERHPGLWHAVLWPVTRLTRNPVGMQVLSVAIGGATTYLIARKAPFGRLTRALLPFGYFLAYEYGVISRNYGLGVLLIIAMCVSYRRSLWWAAAAAFLASQSSAHAMVVAVSLAAGMTWARLSFGEERIRWTQALGPLALVGVGGALCLWQLSLPGDAGLSGWASANLEAATRPDVLRPFAYALAPLPKPELHFWGSYLINDLPGWRLVPLIVVVPALAILALAGSRVPYALGVLLLGGAGLGAGYFVSASAFPRHVGFAWVLVVTVAWLIAHGRQARVVGVAESASSGRQPDAPAARLAPVALALIAGLHVVGTAIAGVSEVQHTFSNAPLAAEYIKDYVSPNVELIGLRDVESMAVLGMAARDRMYYPTAGRFGSFIVLDTIRMREQTRSDEELTTILPDREAVFISDQPLSDPAFLKLAYFDEPPVVRGEVYYLYRRLPMPRAR